MNTLLRTNWNLKKDVSGETALDLLCSKLDKRKAAIKNASQADVERVVDSFLAYRDIPITILQKAIPEADKDLVEVVKDALLGDYLKRLGSNDYILDLPGIGYDLNIKSVLPEGATPKHAITMTNGTVVYDDSFRDWPLEKIKAVNARHVEVFEIPDYLVQTQYLVEQKYPSLRWFEVGKAVDGINNSVLEDKMEELWIKDKFDKIADYVVAKNFRMPNPVIYYKDGLFLTGNLDGGVSFFHNTLTRFTGSRMKYLMKCKDRYGREFVRNGSSV